MRPSDIGRLVSVADPVVSPDGITVPFSVTRVDMDANRSRSAVWRAARDRPRQPRPGPHGGQGDAAPAAPPRGPAPGLYTPSPDDGRRIWAGGTRRLRRGDAVRVWNV